MLSDDVRPQRMSTGRVRTQKCELDDEIERQRQAIIFLILGVSLTEADQERPFTIMGPNPELLEATRIAWPYGTVVEGWNPDVEWLQKVSTTASEASSKLFHHLPQEVLSNVVRYIIKHPKCVPPLWIFDFPGLKALRLSNRAFAYNHQLMQILFRNVKLLGTISNIALLEDADLRKIAPYVEQITFYPPFHSWVLTFIQFKEIILSQAVEKCCYDDDIIPRFRSFEMVHNLYDILINDHWGKEPFSQTELEEGYGRHLEEAFTGRRLLDSQRLEDQWIEALQTWSNCRSVRIACHECCGDEDDIPEEYTCEIYKHSHSDRFPHGDDDTCRHSFQAVNDRLFGAVVNCLSKSQIQPRKLELEFYTAGAYGWDELPGWEQLDLSKLESLRFDPQAHSQTEVAVLYETDNMVPGERMGMAMNEILRKCSSTITHVVHNQQWSILSPLVWPGSILIPFPELRCVTLHNCIVDADQFAKLLPLLPKFVDFQMHGVLPKHEWRALFDAVRDHPKRLQLDWELSFADGDVVRAHYNAGEVAQTPRPEMEGWTPRDASIAKVQRSLQNYLAGSGRWNKALRVRFDFEADDGIDSEDDAH